MTKLSLLILYVLLSTSYQIDSLDKEFSNYEEERVQLNIPRYGYNYLENFANIAPIDHLVLFKKFYEKYGGIALAAGLFFPIIRTFSPIVSGIIKVDFKRFFLFTSVGSVLYIASFVLAGYLLGNLPFLKPYLKFVIIVIIVLVTVPVVIRIIREFRKPKKEY